MTWVPGSQEYVDHLEEQNVCETYDKHFDTPSNLEHVSKESTIWGSR